MKPTVKKYQYQIIITLLLFVSATAVTLFYTEHSLNNALQNKYNQLTNTVNKRIVPAINQQKDSVFAAISKPNNDSSKNRFGKEKIQRIFITDPYKDSTLHALHVYMEKANRLEIENNHLKQVNSGLNAELLTISKTNNDQEKLITAGGSYKDAKLTAHLKQAKKFDEEGHLIYDSSNFNYDYRSDSILKQTEIVTKKVHGLPFKQEEIKITNGTLTYSLKQPFAVLQWQLLFNSSYKLANYNNAKRIGINIGTGFQANTLGLNSRVAAFYNTTQTSGNVWQRINVSLQLQKPLRTFKIK